MDQAKLQAVREKQMEKQSRWMRERQAEMERVRALEELVFQQQASEPPQQVLYPSSGPQNPASHMSAQHSQEQQQHHTSYGVSQPLNVNPRASNAPCQQPQHANTRPEQVIDLALERITERLRAELKLELQNETNPGQASQAAAVAAAQQLDGFLAQELEAQNTCPICYDLMVPPQKAPVLLFPCGHTFCQTCTSNHMDHHKKTTCPVCRKKIDSKAPNYSLQQLILNFVARRDRQPGRGATATQQSLQEDALALNGGADGGGLQGESGLGAASEEGATADLLRRQNERLNFRLKVLQNELLDVITEEQALQQRLVSAGAVQTHIEAQEQDVLRRLEALHAELALVREQKEEQALKVKGVREEASRTVEQRALLTATIEPCSKDSLETMNCLQQRGGALKLQRTDKLVPQVLLSHRRQVCSRKVKQVGKPSVRTLVAAPERPAEEKPVDVLGVDNFVSLTDEQYDVKKEPLAWTKQWYPVGVLNDMDTSKPNLVRLAGGKFVLWCDSKGRWHFQQDRCPHRLAPMSEGKINEDDTLQCSYHGWKFRGDGTCAHIPQANPVTHDAKAAHPKSCLKSYPVEIRHGLIWAFPDDSPDRFVVAAGTELAPEAPPQNGKDTDGTDREGLTWNTLLPWFSRTFPYTVDTLFDNVLDPSHVPWSHHGVIGNRNKAGTLELKVVEPPSPKGLKVEYFTYQPSKPNSKPEDKGEAVRTQVQFRAPHTLVYDTFREDGSRSKLLSYGIPTKPGECQVFAQIWDTRSSWINKLPLTALTWWLHQVFMKAADGDIMLLKDQEATLPDVPKGWREFHLPTRADVGVRLWREWLERFTNGISCGPYQLASASDHETAAMESRTLTKEQLLDRYHGHVEKCPKCLSALNACQKYTWVAGVAAAVFAQLSLLSALNLVGPGAAASAGAAAATASLGPLSLPLHTVWAAVFAGCAAACVKLALTLQSIARSFIHEDYVHAHVH